MSMRLKVAAAAVVVALSVTPAFAELLNFSWEYAPGEVATWSQASDPTPVFFETDAFTRVAVSGGTTTSSRTVHQGWTLRAMSMKTAGSRSASALAPSKPTALRFTPAPRMRRYFPRVDTL